MGPKFLSTDEDDLRIFEFVRANPFKSWKDLARSLSSIGLSISSQTLWRRMNKKFNLKANLAKLKPWITERLAENRLKFAIEYVLKSERYYKRFLYADEAGINLFSNDSEKIYVKRLKGEQLQPDKVKGVVKFRGRGKFLVKYELCRTRSLTDLEL